MPTITIPYSQRPQFKPFHARKQRWAVLVVHRRGGKTVASINELIRGALSSQNRAPRFAYLAPFRQQAKIIAWDYLKHFTACVPGRKISEGELYVEFPNGGRVTLYGADNYEALRGIYLDGAVVDEPADMEEEVWTSILRPALSDRQGWCVWIGTPKGRNAFFRLYDRARNDLEHYVMRLPASESKIIAQTELISARAAMSEAAYNREFECSFDAAIEGAIYGEYIDKLRASKRVSNFEPDPGCPAFTFWDIGMSDFGVVWLVQFVGRDILLLDYCSRTGEPASFYVGWVRSAERRHGLVVRKNYLPHDANTRDRGTGRTYVNVCQDSGLDAIQIVPRTPDVWLGINELRQLLPRCYIHQTNCGTPFMMGEKSLPSGLDCLEYYHKKEVNKNGILGEDPVHDEFSHGCLAGDTLIDTVRGLVPLRYVFNGDYVRIGLNRFGKVVGAGQTGIKQVIRLTLDDGSHLDVTASHWMFTNCGVIEAGKIAVGHLLLDDNASCINRLSNSPKGLRAAFSDFIAESGITTGRPEGSTALKSGTPKDSFIKRCGATITALFQRVTLSIAYVDQEILSSWWPAKDGADRSANTRSNGSSKSRSTKRPASRITEHSQTPISGAAKCCIESFTSAAVERCLELGTSTTRTETPKTTARVILKRSHPLSIPSTTRKPIRGWAQPPTFSKSESLGKDWRLVVEVCPLPSSIPVFDLTIEHHHAYSANGVIVSNCDALRTFSEAYRLGMIDGTSYVANDSRRANPPRSQGKLLAGQTAPQLPGRSNDRRVA